MKKEIRNSKTPESVILKRRRRLRDKRLLTSVIQKLAVLVIAAAVIFGLIFGITPMKGGDMEPRLEAGDLLLYYRLEKNPARNDVVIMKRDGKQYVGRLIGMPGDTLIITTDGKINVDGNIAYERNIFYETKPIEEGVKYPVTLKKDEYFILADKRNTAKDSRYFGPVKAEEIKGKVLTVIKRISL